MSARYFRAHWVMFCALSLAGYLPPIQAGEFPVSGNHEVLRGDGKPTLQAIPFGAPKAGDYYFLRIHNGEGFDSSVTAGSVAVNGKTLLDNRDFKKSTVFFEVPLELELQNKIDINLGGKPGSGFRIEVVGVDEVKPEISATIAPDANAAGWHNQDVLITFTCTDDLSGVASCSEPVTVTGEGGAQLVTGSAVDLAGNSSETVVSISLDKTPPEVSTSIEPLPNSAGWHKDPVTISYQCDDALSGVKTCPGQTAVTEEGKDQQIIATAIDVAGNRAEARSTVQLDLNSPEIHASVTPSANSAGWHNAPVTVSYECDDYLSGVASCSDLVTLAGDGLDQIVAGDAVDQAGNTASTNVTVNIDQTSPEISFLSPVDGSLIRQAQPELQLLLSDNLALDADSLTVTAAGNAITSCEVSGNVAHCSLSAPLAADAEVMLKASVRDLAGNNAETSISTAIDSDGDSVADYADQCSETASSETVNADGCALTQLDSDSDGVNDAEEVAAGSDPEDSNSFPPVLIEIFAASPTAIDSKGQQVELRWKVTGAQQIVLSSDSGDETAAELASEGLLAVIPQITTRYTLTATGPAGEVSQGITVKLDLPPPPELWTVPSIPVQEQIATSLAVAEDGSAYVGAFDGNFYKINSSGQLEWALEDAGLVMGKAAIAGDRIIVGANISGSRCLESAGRVYTLDFDKSALWSFETEGAVVAGPLLAPDKTIAYIATYTGHIYALYTQTGEQRWHYRLPQDQKITSSPAISGQRLIVHTEGRKIFALDIGEAPVGDRILWSRTLQ